MPTIIGFSRQGKASLRSRSGIPVFEEDIHFIVQADYATQPRLEIVAASGLPQLNITTSSNGVAVCRGIDATQRTSKVLIWDVVCSFSSEVEENQGDTGTDPAAWIPIYETKSESLQEVLTKDQSGDTIANSAGVPFEVGLTVTRRIPVWEFYQFESSAITDEQILERSETVNSGTFRGRAAKSLLCVVLSSSIGFFYGQKRRLTHYSVV
jgi:hypothetical protein